MRAQALAAARRLIVEGPENVLTMRAVADAAGVTYPNLSHHFGSAAGLHAAIAEDLVRGYRIDIWEDGSKQWHSLCQRSAHYDIGSGAVNIDVPVEEGTVRLAATTSSDPASNPDQDSAGAGMI